MVYRVVPIACAIAFTLFLGFTGIPTLRHDWSGWIPHGGFYSNAWSSISGWRTDGFGSPRPYPTDYLLAIANVAIFSVFRSYGGYLVDVFLIGYAVASGGVRIVRCWCDLPIAAVAGALFVTFNPWTYNEVVAGHIYMVLAYGAMLLLVAEIFCGRTSPFRLSAFAVLTMGQLQFFAPSLLAIAVWTLVTRRSAWPLAVGIVASLPVWVGLAAERGFLTAIPYTLTWQSNASVDPWSATGMGGYFAQYADALPWYAAAGAWCAVALAVTGAAIGLIRAPRSTLLVILAYFGVWSFVGGDKGILGGSYAWLVRHVPATGLYRELYDGVAFMCIAYAVAGAYLCSRAAYARWIWLACGLALFAGWVMEPPARYWVPASKLPVVSIAAPPNTRYALMPPLQPIRFLWGSGLDPDAVVLSDNVTPLNTQQFGYPESPALMRYAITGDTRELSALSVSRIIERPQFETDVQKLGDQLALAPAAPEHGLAAKSAIVPMPELSLTPLPALSAVPAPLWENAIFFGDAAGLRGPGVPAQWQKIPPVHVVAPPSSHVSAADGWVDARSAFVALPDLSQALGGTVTTNPYSLLPIDPQEWTLAFIDGRLEDAGGHAIAASTRGYRWLPPPHAAVVRCRGLCVVVAQSARPYEASAAAPGSCSAALDFSLPASWLALSTAPVSEQCLLRYNVRFDPHWGAWAGGTMLAHVAVDSTANGWIVPAHGVPERLIIVEKVAALQFLLEAAAVLFLTAAAAGYGVRRLWSAHGSS